MKILHLCNDFSWTKVHSCLYKALDDLGIKQTVFTCVRDSNLKGRNSFEAKGTNFVYNKAWRPYYRFLYHLKIRNIYRELRKEIDLCSYDCVHAVTLFSDGALAYQVKKEYGKPYIVSVRNTDVNTFLGYAPHTWLLGRKILLHASKIVFISVALKKKFCKHNAIRGLLPQIEDKIVIQPNGIDDYWLDCVQKEKKLEQKVLYVGRFDSNKNVLRLIKAVVALQKQFPKIELNLVGGYGNQEKKVKACVQKHPQLIHYHGEIHDNNVLKKIYNSSAIFAMPSIFETFGLVYIEALTQNLKLLYTRGQGIDGLFKEKIGESVNPLSVKDIRHGLAKLLAFPNAYDGNRDINFELFRWRVIADVYKKMYLFVSKKERS